MTSATAESYAYAIVLALAIGCTASQSPPPDPVFQWIQPHAYGSNAEPQRSHRFDAPVTALHHMRQQFDDLRAIEQHLLAGRLDDGRAMAQLLVARMDDATVAPWRDYSKRVAAAAVELSNAPTLDVAARKQAYVAAQCGGCHVAARSAHVFASPPSLPRGQVARHAWAAHRLCEGVVGADDERWTSALAVLADATLDTPAATTKLAIALQRRARAQLDASATTAIAERGAAYGEILVICASCHSTLPGATRPDRAPPRQGNSHPDTRALRTVM